MKVTLNLALTAKSWFTPTLAVVLSDAIDTCPSISAQLDIGAVQVLLNNPDGVSWYVKFTIGIKIL
jgi:hypothetical protein